MTPRNKEPVDFAANVIGVMLLMLKDRYSNTEIKRMLRANKVDGMLKILDSKNSVN